MADSQWTSVHPPSWKATTAALAAALYDGWRAGATALWAAGRRREAAWLRADYRAAAAVVEEAGSGRPRDVAAALRKCRVMAARSARHPLLAAPWQEAARVLAVAAGPAATGRDAAEARRPRPALC